MGCSRGAARCTAPTPAFVRMARIATTSSASLGLFGVTWYSLMVCDISPSACCHWASEALEANRQSPAGMRHSACRQSPWTDVFDIDASQRTIKRSKTPTQVIVSSTRWSTAIAHDPQCHRQRSRREGVRQGLLLQGRGKRETAKEGPSTSRRAEADGYTAGCGRSEKRKIAVQAGGGGVHSRWS